MDHPLGNYFSIFNAKSRLELNAAHMKPLEYRSGYELYKLIARNKTESSNWVFENNRLPIQKLLYLSFSGLIFPFDVVICYCTISEKLHWERLSFWLTHAIEFTSKWFWIQDKLYVVRLQTSGISYPGIHCWMQLLLSCLKSLPRITNNILKFKDMHLKFNAKLWL